MDNSFTKIPPPRSAHHSTLLYMFPQPESPSLTTVCTAELANHILEISEVSNTVLLIWGGINFSEIDLLSFSLARALTFELNILREGIERLNGRQYKNYLDPSCHYELTATLQRFDQDFGDVKKLRNILAHFEDYCFPRQPIPPLKYSEALKLKPAIDVQPGAEIYLKNIFFSNSFCSGDRSGVLRKIFIGPEFQYKLFSMLSSCLGALRFNGAEHQFKAIYGLSQNEHDSRRTQFRNDFQCCGFAHKRTRRSK